MEKVAGPNSARLQGPLVMKCTSIDVIGQKAVVEAEAFQHRKMAGHIIIGMLIDQKLVLARS